MRSRTVLLEAVLLKEAEQVKTFFVLNIQSIKYHLNVVFINNAFFS